MSALTTSASVTHEILAERLRQISEENYSPRHDDDHVDASLALAGAAYCLRAGLPVPAAGPPSFWPWSARDWKDAGPRRNLVKAGALIVAEIERLDRLHERDL